jgi:putative SOS response-associated peptidase YedK
MCNLYSNKVAPDAIARAFEQLGMSLAFPDGTPNLQPRDEIRITDTAPIVRWNGDEGQAELVQRRWSWPAPGGKPVYNFRSDGREFANFDKGGRCLIVADGFYEFTTPTAPRPDKRKDRWRFTLAGHDWFAIAGLWRAGETGEAFTMLTTEPGADVAPYHNRQVAVLAPERWRAWLDVEPRRDRAFGPARGEEGGRLGGDPVEPPGLETAPRADRVAVHRIAAPEHRPALGPHRPEQRRQGVGDPVGPHPGDQRDSARLAHRVEPVEEPQQEIGGEGRPALDPERVGEAAQELDMGGAVEAGAVADPQEMAGGAVPAGAVPPHQRLLVGKEQGLVAGPDAVGPRPGGGEMAEGRGRLRVGAEHPLGIGPPRGLVEGETVDDVAAIGGKAAAAAALEAARARLGELAGDPRDLDHV